MIDRKPILQQIANQIRTLSLQAIHAARSGHPGGCLSIADILAVLYFDVMGEDDTLILSKGHAVPALYAALHLKGVITKEELMSLRKLGSKCQGHCDRRWLPEVGTSTGSLGQGMAFAVGLALARKRAGSNSRVFCIIGDGDLQEGITVEAARLAAYWDLDNLTVICDRNRKTSDRHSIDTVRDAAAEFRAYGWWAGYADGHDIGDVITTLSFIQEQTVGPGFLELRTIKGRGVSFMESDPDGYHGSLMLSDKELEEAIGEIQGEQI